MRIEAPAEKTRASRKVSSTASQPLIENPASSSTGCAGVEMLRAKALDRRGLVLYTGSFSKVLFPSLRLGYLVVPSDLVDRVAAVKSVATRGAPMLEQAVLADFMAHGHFGRHVRRMRNVYADRLGVLLACAEQRLSGLLELSPVEAGLQTTAWLGGGIESAADAAAAAERHDVEVTPLSRCFPPGRSGRPGLVLGFAAVGADEIRRGVRDLAVALEECARARQATATTRLRPRAGNK